MLGDFTVKKNPSKLRREICILKLDYVETKCAVLQIITIIVTYVQKNSNSIFNQAVIDKISNFHEIAPNLTYSQKIVIFKYNCNFLDQLLLPYKFYGRYMSGIYFFIFTSCEPLNNKALP